MDLDVQCNQVRPLAVPKAGQKWAFKDSRYNVRPWFFVQPKQLRYAYECSRSSSKYTAPRAFLVHGHGKDEEYVVWERLLPQQLVYSWGGYHVREKAPKTKSCRDPCVSVKLKPFSSHRTCTSFASRRCQNHSLEETIPAYMYYISTLSPSQIVICSDSMVISLLFSFPKTFLLLRK
jgi:hypothetical protein